MNAILRPRRGHRLDTSRSVVSVHNITWSATASAVGSKEVIEHALQWMTGDHAELSNEKVKSYHGAKMILIHGRIVKKKAAKLSLTHLGADFLRELAQSEQLKSRIDQDNVLHIRLSLQSLASGSIEFASRHEEQVKGRIKLEVYPGQKPEEIAHEMLVNAAKIASDEGLPMDPNTLKFR